MVNRPEKITFKQSVESIRDIGSIALDSVKEIVGDVADHFDTKRANALNNEEDE